ncbi:MAG: zinc ribbon domain-containing protein [Armatimonadetes bacterium]|nr:zinc ribbon domain-containing protein [Armatimonadota bacterium]
MAVGRSVQGGSGFGLPLAKSGRLLQGLAALLLQASPLLPWVQFPLLGMTLIVPGILLHGALVMAAGVFSLGLLAMRVRLPGVQILLALFSAWWINLDARFIAERTPYYLKKLQLSLVGVNDLLTKVGQNPIDVVPSGWQPGDFVALGVWVAAASCALLIVGAVLEARDYRRGMQVGWVLLGWPRCAACSARVYHGMSYCPSCRHGLLDGAPCERCGAWVQRGWKWCAQCGADARV